MPRWVFRFEQALRVVISKIGSILCSIKCLDVLSPPCTVPQEVPAQTDEGQGEAQVAPRHESCLPVVILTKGGPLYGEAVSAGEAHPQAVSVAPSEGEVGERLPSFCP